MGPLSSFSRPGDGIPAEIVNTGNIHFRLMKESFRVHNRSNCFLQNYIVDYLMFSDKESIIFTVGLTRLCG